MMKSVDNTANPTPTLIKASPFSRQSTMLESQLQYRQDKENQKPNISNDPEIVTPKQELMNEKVKNLLGLSKTLEQITQIGGNQYRRRYIDDVIKESDHILKLMGIKLALVKQSESRHFVTYHPVKDSEPIARALPIIVSYINLLPETFIKKIGLKQVLICQKMTVTHDKYNTLIKSQQQSGTFCLENFSTQKITIAIKATLLSMYLKLAINHKDEWQSFVDKIHSHYKLPSATAEEDIPKTWDLLLQERHESIVSEDKIVHIKIMKLYSYLYEFDSLGFKPVSVDQKLGSSKGAFSRSVSRIL